MSSSEESMSATSSPSGIDSPTAMSPRESGDLADNQATASGGASFFDILCCRAPKSDVDTELSIDHMDTQGTIKHDGSTDHLDLQRRLSEDNAAQPAEAVPAMEEGEMAHQESVVEGEEPLAKAASATDVGASSFSFFQWCCKPSTNAADEFAIEGQDTGIETEAVEQEAAAAEGLEPQPQAAVAEAQPPSVVETSVESQPQPEPAPVSIPIPPAEEKLEKPEPAAAIEESEGKGLEEAAKYNDYKSRFPETAEAELRQWSQTEGCYLVLDESSNKFYAKWSRVSVPNALAFYTIHPDVQAPTRALDAGERVNLLVERGAIKKLLKAAVVAFCKQASKYDGYFSLLNTTLWSRAGLGNLEVVWLCSDESIFFCKRDTPPINLAASGPTVIGAVDNSFRLQGVSKSKRKITPRWTKSSFVNTVRSITDSSVAEIDPRTKAPRKG